MQDVGDFPWFCLHACFPYRMQQVPPGAFGYKPVRSHSSKIKFVVPQLRKSNFMCSIATSSGRSASPKRARALIATALGKRIHYVEVPGAPAQELNRILNFAL